MNSDVKSLLTDLQKINEDNTISIRVPSTNKKASFKLINVSQQKKLLTSALEGFDGVIKRTNILNSILFDNCVNDVEFLIVDRSAVLLALRKEIIGADITIKDTTYSLDNLEPFDMSSIELASSVEYDNIKINLKVPTLKIDTEVNSKIEKEFLKLESQEDKIKRSLDLVISYETSKYIESVYVGEHTISFDDISPYERRIVVDNLPLALNNKILEYIEPIKKAIDNTLQVADEVIVEIDASFLTPD